MRDEKTRNEYKKAWYQKHKERMREYHAEWQREWRKNNPEEARINDKEKAIKYSDKRKKYAAKYAKTHKKDPIKTAARTILNNAINTGKLKRETVCSQCRLNSRIQAHHPDYSKPLDVKWLCTKCHALEHHPLPALEDQISSLTEVLNELKNV